MITEESNNIKPEALEYPAPPMNEINKDELDEINKNYPLDLSHYQRLTFKIQDENDPNKDKKFEFFTDENFEDDLNNAFYIFYSNKLPKLEGFYKSELGKLVKEHNIVLYHISDYLKKLDNKYDEDYYYSLFRLGSKLISFKYQPIVDRARDLAKNLIKIREIKKKLQINKNNHDENSYIVNLKKKFCQIIVDEKDIYKEIDYKYDTEDEARYIRTEISFCQLENQYRDSLNYIVELEKLLDKFYEEIGQNVAGINNRHYLCFVFNRASHYLSIKEQIRENLDHDILFKMYKLRRKINNLLLEYRFKYIQNRRIILDIEIRKCKILKNEIDIKSIYIEKGECKNFITKMEESLTNKAENLRTQNNFEPMTINEIREIAQIRDINITSNEQIIKAMEDKLEELKDQKEQNDKEIQSLEIELATKKGKDLITPIIPGNQILTVGNLIPNENINKEEEDIKKKEEKLKKLKEENKKIERSINRYNNQLYSLRQNHYYDIEFINILKLYSKLIRKRYDLRNDYLGIIITEKKLFDNKGNENSTKREYEICENNKIN